MQSKFLFGDIVVYEKYLIGVVLKTWYSSKNGYNYDVYIRSFNTIINVDEMELERYRVRHKELNEEEMMYQNRKDD